MTQEHRCDSCNKVTSTNKLHRWSEVNHSATALDESIMLCNLCYKEKLILYVLKTTCERVKNTEDTIDNICDNALAQIQNIDRRFK